MCVAQRHFQIRVAEEFSNRVEINTCLHEARGERMPGVMETKVLNLCRRDDDSPCLLDVVEW
jgi:hypothetical protein